MGESIREIDESVTHHYEIKRRIGKGVSTINKILLGHGCVKGVE